jgi:glycosyltransferase involved in cell wall biosynthesis
MPAVKPPRVVMIFQSYLPEVGGAQKQLSMQAPFLQARGVDVQVLARRRKGMKAVEVLDGVPVHRLPAWGPKPVAAALFIFSAVWKVWRLRPDLIHAYELLSPTTTAIFAKKLLRVPLIVKVLRGGELGDWYKVLRGRGGKKRAQWIVNSVDAYAVISREIDAELAGQGVPPEKRFFIPNGVDLERFRPVDDAEKLALRARLGLPDGRIAVFAGRLDPEKRLDQLLSLWPRVRERLGNVSLVLAGSGSEEMRLRTLAGDGVHFIGRVEDVIPYYQAADVFVLPSATEGLSNSLLEALACGLPAVATTVGGATDVITHGEHGWLIPPDAPDRLEEGLLRVLGDDALRAKFGRAGRAQIEATYSLATVVERLAALYAKLLSAEGIGR